MQALTPRRFLTCPISLLTVGAAHLRYWRRFSSDLRRPASVFGPVLSPPCQRQRFRPRTFLAWHGVPKRVRARHFIRSGL